MKKTTVFDLMNTLTDYVYSEVPTGDFESAEDLKAALMETLGAITDMVIHDNFQFGEEDEEEND